MDDKAKRENVFPEGFSQLEQLLKDTQAEVNRLDDVIENLPPDEGPKLRFDPPGMSGGNWETRHQATDRLNADRQKAINAFYGKMEKDVAGKDPKLAAQVKDIAAFRLSDNPYNTAIKKNAQTKDANHKTEFTAFDRIEYLQFDREIGRDDKQDNDRHYTLDEMTVSFLAKFSYPDETPYQENTKDLTMDGRDFEPDKE